MFLFWFVFIQYHWAVTSPFSLLFLFNRIFFFFPKHSNVYLDLILGQNQALAKASSADRERLKRHACEIHTNGELGQFMTSMVNNVKYMELLCHLNSRGNL